MGLALGPRAARLAHRVLGDGRGRSSALDFDVHGGGLGPASSRITRTRSRRPRPAAGRRSPRCGCTTAWCETRGEKMAKSVGNIFLLHAALDEYGRDALVMYLCGGHYRQPLAFSARAPRPRPRRASRGSARPARRLVPGGRAPPSSRRCASGSSTRSPRTSTPPAALGALFDWVREANRRDAGERRRCGPARDARAARARGPARRRGRERGGAGRGGRASCSRAASRPAPARDFAEADRLRDALRGARAGRSGTRPDGPGAARRPPRDRLRPQRRCARRSAGRRAVSARVGDTGARRAEAWLARRGGRAWPPRRRSSAAAAPRRTRASAPSAGPLPLRRRRRPARRRRAPLIVALDEVQDPQNLGAVCRTAECAGATGAGGARAPLGRGGHGRGLQGLGGRGGAPADRPRAQSRRLARRRQARGLLGATARPARSAHGRTTQPDYRGGVVLVLGSEGRGLRPRVAAACDELVALPMRGRVESLNVRPPPRRWCTRSCSAREP